MNKAAIALILFTCVVLSCNSEKSNELPHQRPSEPSLVSTERRMLVQEIRKLKAVFKSEDRTQIANILPFPLNDSLFPVYVEDPSFVNAYERAGRVVTRELFSNHFKLLYDYLNISQLNELFRMLPIDSLHYKDEIATERVITSAPCTKTYGIKVEPDRVSLEIGAASNKSYIGILTEDETPANSSEYCEHVTWWIFRVQNGKLVFEQFAGAG